MWVLAAAGPLGLYNVMIAATGNPLTLETSCGVVTLLAALDRKGQIMQHWLLSVQWLVATQVIHLPHDFCLHLSSHPRVPTQPALMIHMIRMIRMIYMVRIVRNIRAVPPPHVLLYWACAAGRVRAPTGHAQAACRAAGFLHRQRPRALRGRAR